MIRKVVNYETKHLEQIVNNIRNLEKIQLDKIKTDLMAWNEMILKDTPYPKTGLADGRPVAIGGISRLWDGVGEGWLIGSQDFKSHMFFICKHVRKYIKEYTKIMGINRLQAVVSASNKDVYRFAEKFAGFTYEGYLHSYGMDGTDQLMFARWGLKDG